MTRKLWGKSRQCNERKSEDRHIKVRQGLVIGLGLGLGLGHGIHVGLGILQGNARQGNEKK
jgi:hypothetical protein